MSLFLMLIKSSSTLRLHSIAGHGTALRRQTQVVGVMRHGAYSSR